MGTPQLNHVMAIETAWPQTDICMVCYKIIGTTTTPPHIDYVRRQQGVSSMFGRAGSRQTPVAPRYDSHRHPCNRPSFGPESCLETLPSNSPPRRSTLASR